MVINNPPLGVSAIPVAVAEGGTGSTTASGARGNLAAAPNNAGYWTDAANAELTAERSLAGFTGLVLNTAGAPSGAVNGTNFYGPGTPTPIPVGEGGTNATTAAGARTNLGAQQSNARLDDIAAMGVTNGFVVQGNGTNLVLAAAPSGASSGAWFGDGSDGNVTIAVDTTLTRDMYYDALTVNGGGVDLFCDGFRIFAKTSVTCSGTIHDRDPASKNGAAAGTAGTAYAAGPPLPSGSNGGAGGTAAGSAGSAAANALGVAAGAGGAGSGGAGGAAGTLTVMTANNGGTQQIKSAAWGLSVHPRTDVATGTCAVSPGGGGGGGDGTAGGGGGAGGGVVMILTPSLSGAGTISAKGGNGGSPAAGNRGGGGGGGGGIVYILTATAHSVTVDVAGGTGGTKTGTGVNGSNGSAGVNQSMVLG